MIIAVGVADTGSNKGIAVVIYLNCEITYRNSFRLAEVEYDDLIRSLLNNEFVGSCYLIFAVCAYQLISIYINSSAVIVFKSIDLCPVAGFNSLNSCRLADHISRDSLHMSDVSLNNAIDVCLRILFFIRPFSGVSHFVAALSNNYCVMIAVAAAKEELMTIIHIIRINDIKVISNIVCRIRIDICISFVRKIRKIRDVEISARRIREVGLDAALRLRIIIIRREVGLHMVLLNRSVSSEAVIDRGAEDRLIIVILGSALLGKLNGLGVGCSDILAVLGDVLAGLALIVYHKSLDDLTVSYLIALCHADKIVQITSFVGADQLQCRSGLAAVVASAGLLICIACAAVAVHPRRAARGLYGNGVNIIAALVGSGEREAEPLVVVCRLTVLMLNSKEYIVEVVLGEGNGLIEHEVDIVLDILLCKGYYLCTVILGPAAGDVAGEGIHACLEQGLEVVGAVVVTGGEHTDSCIVPVAVKSDGVLAAVVVVGVKVHLVELVDGVFKGRVVLDAVCAYDLPGNDLVLVRLCRRPFLAAVGVALVKQSDERINTVVHANDLGGIALVVIALDPELLGGLLSVYGEFSRRRSLDPAVVLPLPAAFGGGVGAKAGHLSAHDGLAGGIAAAYGACGGVDGQGAGVIPVHDELALYHVGEPVIITGSEGARPLLLEVSGVPLVKAAALDLYQLIEIVDILVVVSGPVVGAFLNVHTKIISVLGNGDIAA